MLSRFFAVILLTLACNAHSFSLSPCLRVLKYKDGEIQAGAVKLSNIICPNVKQELKRPVHEVLTVWAIAEYKGRNSEETLAPSMNWVYQYAGSKWWEVTQGRPHSTEYLIYGTWWNDDPLMFMWGEGDDFGAGIKKFYKVFNGSGKGFYKGDQRNCSVPASIYLPLWSHYGSMQFLHFMTPQKLGKSTRLERMNGVIESVRRWFEFSYSVATGQRGPEDYLGADIEAATGLPPIWKNNCLESEKSAKIRTLFTRVGPVDRNPWRNAITPDVALGSMLHVIQDSYSPAHTCRTDNGGGDLFDVFNYEEQNESAHRNLDDFPDWLKDYAATGRHRHEHDPITIGAWLLEAVDKRLPWCDVWDYLTKTAFLVERDDAANVSCHKPN